MYIIGIIYYLFRVQHYHRHTKHNKEIAYIISEEKAITLFSSLIVFSILVYYSVLILLNF